MYDVGFGDCFLVTFPYSAKLGGDRHVLIDFGSTGLRRGTPPTRMRDVAEDIRATCGKRLHAVVATHRHRDHVSGFATAKGGRGPGDIVAALKPQVVVQPWTEHPRAAKDAKAAPSLGPRDRLHIKGLAAGAAFVKRLLDDSKLLAGLGPELRKELAFIGEDNLPNLSAVKNLVDMGRKGRACYVNFGSKSGLEKLLPGVKVHVLGPPTLEQTNTISKQRRTDPEEFWHLQRRILDLATGRGAARTARGLFPRARRLTAGRAPASSRWFVDRLKGLGRTQVRAIVRALDDQMNNTSVILLFEVGKKKLLFSGDAQIENWAYALSRPEVRQTLAGVDLYKVGHHGSLNATPKSLWRLFAKRGPGTRTGRLKSLVSTLEGKHGSVKSGTEVPRSRLVEALDKDSDYYTTQPKGAVEHASRGLEKGRLYRDVTV